MPRAANPRADPAAQDRVISRGRTSKGVRAIRKYDLASSLFWVVCGAAIVVAALQLPVGRIARPGPGLFPLLLGATLAGLGLALLLQATGTEAFAARSFWADASGGRRVVEVIAVLLIYSFAVEPLGFLAATFLLLAFLFRVTFGFRWGISLAAAAGISLVSHLVFVTWLRVNLPPGWLSA